MLETEKQRRWWFATHPEFSWSRKGAGTRSETKDQGATAVHGYADKAVTYAKRSVAEALKSLRQYLGREEDLGDALTRYMIEHNPSGHISTVRWPKLPTPQEFHRGTGGMFKEYLRTLDRIIPPLAIDEEYVKNSRALWKEFQKRMAEPGPGEWVLVPRSPLGLEHQSRKSGSPIIKKDGKYHIYEYRVINPVTGDPMYFDDYRHRILYEDKGRQGNLINRKTKEFYPWCDEIEDAKERADKHLQAAQGIPVVWRVGADQVHAYKKAIGDRRGLSIVP